MKVEKASEERKNRKKMRGKKIDETNRKIGERDKGNGNGGGGERSMKCRLQNSKKNNYSIPFLFTARKKLHFDTTGG